MNIFINGESTNVTVSSMPNVADALAIYIKEAQQKTTYAVALNSTFVSKQTYADTSLKEGDALDILFPIVGG